MKEPDILKVDLGRIASTLKEALLGQSDKIACHTCNKPYCCQNQIRISVSDIEFQQILPIITDEHRERARYQSKNKRMMNGQLTYTCPFNNPDTGMCEIYDNRFVVCAGHGVVADSEEACNTETNNTGTMIVNPLNTMQIAMKEYDVMQPYLFHLSKGEDLDILECFEKFYDR